MRSLTPSCVVLALAASASAADIHVPADHATIQQALDASAPGDVVHVAPGTWREALVVPPHALTLVGDEGAAVTLLDATGTGTSAVFCLPTDEPRVLRGFTITGGSGAPGTWGWPAGGGVHGETSPATEVRECVVTGNSAWSLQPLLGEGGGIYLSGSVFDCVIEGNQAVSGGGISSTGRIERCLVRGNTALIGGGIASSSAIVDSVVEDNVAWGQGGGLRLGSAAGLSGVVVRHNTAPDGGGLYVSSTELTLRLTGCTFFENVATGRGGGAWLHAMSSPLPKSIEVERCAFIGNAAGPGGGDLEVDGIQVQDVTLRHCTFVADAIVAPKADFSSCVIRDVPAWMAGIAGPIAATWSDLPGGWPGAGNFDADPFLAAAELGDVSLLPGSPCIDTGDPVDPPDADGTRADVGSEPFHPWADLGPGLGGAWGVPVLAGDGSLIGGSSTTLIVAGASPQAPALLVMGSFALLAPFKGGTLVPNAQELLGLFATDAAGGLVLQGAYPTGLPSGQETLFQVWLPDGTSPQGWTATNGLKGTTR